MANSYNFALFGQPIYHGYYTHHSIDDQFMAWGPLKFGGSRALYFGEKPTIPMEKAGRMSFTQFAVLTGYLAALVFGYYYGAMPTINASYTREQSKAKFDAWTWGYFFVGFLGYHYLLGPSLGINTGRLLAEFKAFFN